MESLLGKRLLEDWRSMDVLSIRTVRTRKTRRSVSIRSGSSALVILLPRFLDEASHGVDSVI